MNLHTSPDRCYYCTVRCYYHSFLWGFNIRHFCSDKTLGNKSKFDLTKYNVKGVKRERKQWKHSSHVSEQVLLKFVDKVLKVILPLGKVSLTEAFTLKEGLDDIDAKLVRHYLPH